MLQSHSPGSSNAPAEVISFRSSAVGVDSENKSKRPHARQAARPNHERRRKGIGGANRAHLHLLFLRAPMLKDILEKHAKQL